MGERKNSCVIKKKIALLSNVTVDLLIGKLRRQYDFYIPDGFDTWVQEVINSASELYESDVDAMVILLDGTEARSWRSIDEAKERLSLWKQALVTLCNKITLVPIFISTIDIRENRIKSLSERKMRLELENEWYQFVQDLADEKSNVYIMDIADTIAEIGRKQFYSNKMWYMSSMPYSREGLLVTAKEIKRALSAAFDSRKKIVVLDLDNTLWGGVIGEDGVDGLELSDHKEGQRYYDFQRQLLEMKQRGIVLAINSKNNVEDAEAAINTHPSMLLHSTDFVSKKINWKNKSINLKEMEHELNITEAGFIFIDDNPVERETIKGECPEVTVPDFPKDSTELLSFAEDIYFDYCCPLRVLGEDMQKTKMYRSESLRQKEKSVSLNLDDYIARLGISIDIHRMQDEELERVTQLLNKTNQFNLTTKRYTAAEVKALAANPDNDIYVVHSEDKYGDNGLISVVIVIGGEQEVYIDTFLMSCRVMGRKLEDVIINELAAKYVGKNIIAEYIPTAKNAPVKNLYDRLGFYLVVEDSQHKQYEMDTNGYRKKHYAIYKEIKFMN